MVSEILQYSREALYYKEKEYSKYKWVRSIY
jgi:hypothetical protein